ncbi:WD repeat-containing protein 17-like [Tachypleus tridentatus]|uniref:WD repeat-containing protein 17-like n=1 Tax=Tachypleus tridentatus TaxID=6853 RepID=UPI003FD111F0
MSMVRQIALLEAGCQPWHSCIIAARGNRFAYAATLAIYIYEMDRKQNTFCLQSIMSEHKKTITCLTWHQTNEDCLASASVDPKICIWNVAQHALLACLKTPLTTPTLITWYPEEIDSLVYLESQGPLYLWRFSKSGNCSSGNYGTLLKEIQPFLSSVTQIQWNSLETRHLALGHQDGTVSLYLKSQKPKRHVKLNLGTEDNTESCAITGLEWDPLSPHYLLIAIQNSGLLLADTSGNALQTIMIFNMPSKASTVQTVAWIPDAPGMFVSGDCEAGVLRVWTVSQKGPLENISLKHNGFHAIHVVCCNQKQSLTHGRTENPKVNQKRTSFCGRGYAVPRAKIACLFIDGGVGLYDLRKGSWDFFRDTSHIETIFDCQFKPSDFNVLATGSFDGTIKIWNVLTMKNIATSPGNKSIIYSISWAPLDLNCIAAGTSDQGVVIWSITQRTISKRFTSHGKGVCVFCVSWNQKDARKIASAAADNNCMIHHADGTLIQSFKHPGTVYGCDWNPSNENILATACEDKQVRVFYVGSSNSQPLKILSGHTLKVFRVKWSLLKDGILCSSSDDKTVKVWDYTTGSTCCTLSGHTKYVHALAWSPEIPHILISGSWDATIRVWDIRDGACLDVLEDHGADVYGLSCHPSRPFLLASTSRDSTVRLWSLLPLASIQFWKVLSGKPVSDFIGLTAESTKDPLSPGPLCGMASKQLKYNFLKQNPKDMISTFQLYTELFVPLNGVANLWDLVKVLDNWDVAQLSPQYKHRIVHKKHLTKFKTSEAQELELIKMTRYGTGGVGAKSKEDCLLEAASKHLLAGDLQHYCELKIELGEWEEALAVAPGVSLDYWRNLTSRHAEMLFQSDDDRAVPYLAAIGNTQKLTEFFQNRGNLDEAYSVAVTSEEGTFPFFNTEGSKNSSATKNTHHGNSCLLKECVDKLAECHMRNGSPIHAACVFLAVDDPQKALTMLLRGNEPELVICLAKVMKRDDPWLKTALKYLAWKCTKLGLWDLSIDLLNSSSESVVEKVRLCAHCPTSLVERNQLMEKAFLPPVDECIIKAKELLVNNGDIFETVKFFLISTTPQQGLEVGLKYVKGESKIKLVIELNQHICSD